MPFAARLARTCLIVALVAAAPAASASGKKQGADTLPGVTAPEPIVKPLAEPIPPVTPDANGFVRMGDWDVRVSGSVTVDIGAGTLKALPR